MLSFLFAMLVVRLLEECFVQFANSLVVLHSIFLADACRPFPFCCFHAMVVCLLGSVIVLKQTGTLEKVVTTNRMIMLSDWLLSVRSNHGDDWNDNFWCKNGRGGVKRCFCLWLHEWHVILDCNGENEQPIASPVFISVGQKPGRKVGGVVKDFDDTWVGIGSSFSKYNT